MSKRIGNYVGFSTFLEGDVNVGNKGVWNLIEQFYFRGKNEWIPPLATGGTELTPGNGYKYHVFTSTDNFQIRSPTNIEYLVVAGGGGGGRAGGGGGAGGFRTGNINIVAATYPIVIGSGGIGAPHGEQSGTRGTNGSNSSAFSIVSAGGGGGGSYAFNQPVATPGNPGGSGGGGGTTNTLSIVYPGGTGNSPPVSPPQGNNGGSGSYGPDGYKGGGGGGAGQVGSSRLPGSGVGAPGGNGLAAFSGDIGIPASYGTPGPTAGRWFAGGGGGASGPSPASGSGGSGGGGGPAPSPTITSRSIVDGIQNTGGGGSGGTDYILPGPSPTRMGDGGSGIVIIRYQV